VDLFGWHPSSLFESIDIHVILPEEQEINPSGLVIPLVTQPGLHGYEGDNIDRYQAGGFGSGPWPGRPPLKYFVEIEKIDADQDSGLAPG
jgi:hypothetical protein